MKRGTIVLALGVITAMLVAACNSVGIGIGVGVGIPIGRGGVSVGVGGSVPLPSKSAEPAATPASAP